MNAQKFSTWSGGALKLAVAIITMCSPIACQRAFDAWDKFNARLATIPVLQEKLDGMDKKVDRLVCAIYKKDC